MNVIYISPHYPPHYQQFVESLARHNVRVLGITDQNEEQLPENLRNALTGHYKVDQLENYDQVLAAARFFEENYGKIDRVESHLEPWLELEAEIRKEHNVPGFKPEDIQFIKRKSQMKAVFEKAGVPHARGIIIEDFEQCIDFINQVSYPVFIKPDIGVGAYDTYTIKNEVDLNEFFRVKQDYDYYMEEYVEGDIESFDGLTDSEGNIVFFTSDVFNNDIHKLVKLNQNCWYYTQREIPEELEKYGRAVVKATGTREKFFHIEFFKVKNKPWHYQALEINMRPPGGVTTHMFNFNCDIDVYNWWASIIAGEESKRSYERKYYCAFVGRKYDREYELSHEQVMEMWGNYICWSHAMNPIEAAVMGDWGYLVRSPDKEEMLGIVEDIIAEA
ncbi:MAG: ATP-grasp domain-containing protein [Candidatus Riflebacteria bacterium]|nr:ATP-grasp domain-containing protein [Candidatus Riflebacteria bacterium]